MNYYSFTMNNFTDFTTYTCTTTYNANKVLQFKDQLYCITEDGTIYKYEKNKNWNIMPITALPDQIEIKDGGLFINMNLESDKYQQGEYVGDPVEEITNVCICPMKSLMAEGCKCGGE